MRQSSTAVLFLLACLGLVSCSGVPQGPCTSNCPSNDASLSIVLTATPPPPSSQLSIQAFTATITGVALTPSGGGSDVAVSLNSSSYVAEFTRVTSDSSVLASEAGIPAGSYTQLKVTFAAPRVTFCTQASPGVPGCAAASLASVTGAVGSATIPVNLNLTANQHSGLVLDADLGNAILQTGQTVTGVDFTVANTFSVAALPPASTLTDLASGQLSHVDDVMGLVTNVGGSSITVQTSTRGSITAVANSSTQFSSVCSVQSLSCVQANDDVVIDAVLNSDGTFTLTFLEPLSSGPLDLIEGVVTDVPNSVTSKFTVVATDSAFAPSNSVLNGQLNIGDQVVVTLSASPQPFVIIDKGLANPNIPVNTFQGATSVSAIQPGMTVALPVTAYVAQSGTTPGSASTDEIALRFTRITAVLATAALPDFSANSFAPFFGIATTQQLQTASGRLSVDGAQTLTGIPVGGTISTSALYLGSPANPLFLAQSIRAH